MPGPLKAGQVSYPQPEQITVGSQPTDVFTGKFTIQTHFAAPNDAPAGSATMTGKLRYQACNNQMCFRPSTVEVRVPVSVQ